MAKKSKKSDRSKKRTSSGGSTWIAVLAVGGLGALAGLLAFGRRQSAGDLLARGGSTAADLSLDHPRHGPGDRAPTDFRPDPTAPVDPRKRDAMAPATLPNPQGAVAPSAS